MIDTEQLLNTLEHGVGKSLRVRAGREAAPINRRDARQFHESGESLCVDCIETEIPELAAYVLALQTQLNFPGNLNVAAYLSPEGTGFSYVHIDSRIALTLQIEGSKRWRFAKEPAVHWPVHQPYADSDGHPAWTDIARPWEIETTHGPGELESIVLTPGDALCVPAGTWHSAEATRGASLSLRIGFENPSVIRLLAQVLTEHFEPEPAWRAIPGAWQDRHVDASAELPASVAAHLERRLGELRAFVSSLTVDSLPVKRAWRRSLCTTAAAKAVEAQSRRDVRVTPDDNAPDVAALASAPTASETGDVTPDDRLGLADDLPVLYSVEPGLPGQAGAADDEGAGETVVLIHGRTEIELAGEGLSEFFARLLRTRRFVAHEATLWVADDEEAFEWDEVMPVLELLLSRGVLHRRDGDARPGEPPSQLENKSDR